MNVRTLLCRWLVPCLLLSVLCACGQSAPTWQEQYDLGVRYLSEGNYEEAIIAFTAAIEIDPKRAEAYVGRGDAYISSGETADNLTAALADYEAALELSPGDVELYVKLADVSDRLGDSEAAAAWRAEGYELTEDERLAPVCDHDWAPANYQQPETCRLCGETQGEPLPAVLDTYTGLTQMEVGVAYPYETLCYEDSSLTTVGQAVISSYETISSDATHSAKEGYDWRLVNLTITFQDDNAWEYGMSNRTGDLDYYTGAPFTYLDDSGEIFTVSYNGVEYECLGRVNVVDNQWDGRVFTYSLNFEYQLPVGYDGCVLASYHAKYKPVGSDVEFSEIVDQMLADEGTILFRLD